MILLLEGLHDRRNVRGGLGLGKVNMPLLNDEAEALLANLSAAWSHVYGMPAAGYGDITSGAMRRSGT